MGNVHEILYMQQDESGESFEDEMQEHEFNSANGEPVLANMEVGRAHVGGPYTARMGA